MLLIFVLDDKVDLRKNPVTESVATEPSALKSVFKSSKKNMSLSEVHVHNILSRPVSICTISCMITNVSAI